jgi:hypothetical protein
MRRRASLVLLGALSCAAGPERPPDPDWASGRAPEAVQLLDAHNAARRAVSPEPARPLAPLRWSAAAYERARAWAAGCRFEHGPGGRGFGENLFASPRPATAAQVVASWVGERRGYDHASNSCRGECSHYTQVVWASTRELGCAVERCEGGSPFGGGAWELWVCEYAPAGNLQGERPY